VDDFFFGLWNGVLIGWFAAYVMRVPTKNNNDKEENNK